MKLKQVVVMIGLLLMVALLAGCQPITAEGMMSALAGQPVEDASAMVGEQAMATVTARSLRVRAEPSDSAEVVTGIREGEQFPVIGRSSDGLWIQLDIPRAPGGNGWVSANFVTVQGPITDATVSSAPPAATEAAAEEATPAPTEEAAEAAPTEAPAEEAPAEAAAPASEFETSITIWADDLLTPILLDLAETFQNEYGVGLVVESVADRYDQFPVAAPAGEGPDIILLAHDRIGGFYESGLLAPIDLGDRTAEFKEAAIDAFTYNGDLVGLPYAIENLAFFYNPDKVETAPTTWD
ncbi:MAG: extracellular solute-binding protein, partial [Caldilineaceae bacterium]|nr:extracellular solute-binding protein [Caldilineaceae bacterium]